MNWRYTILTILFICSIQLRLSKQATIKQGRSHQNLSGQVEIISQASIYSDFQIIVVVVHSMQSILQLGV